MRLLAFDTAGPSCAVAVARSGDGGAEILARAEEQIGRGHAERLMPMIEAALAEAGVGFADLDRIAVATGPGSFTGVRVGVAAARGLALALDIPAVGVGSLAALACPTMRSAKSGSAVAALDAKRGEVYLLAEDVASRAVLVGPAAVRIADIATRLAEAARPLILTGAAAPQVAEALGEPGLTIAGTGESPDIADIAALGLQVEHGGPPLPAYARGADAKPQADKVVARL